MIDGGNKLKWIYYCIFAQSNQDFRNKKVKFKKVGEREIHSDSKVCFLELIGFKKSQHWLPWCSDTKESACKAGDLGLILWLGRSPGEGYGNPLQYSCLENSRGTQPATFHGVVESRTPLSDWHTFSIEWYHVMKVFHLSIVTELFSYWNYKRKLQSRAIRNSVYLEIFEHV